MDGSRFDALTRALAAPKSRRGLLGSLAALAAGFAGRSVAGAQVSQAQCGNKACKNNPGKCNDGCVCCVYGNGNTRCTAPGTCSGTPTCPAGEVPDPVLGCVTPATTTTTTTAAPPVVCASSDQCAAGHVCFNGGCFRSCESSSECAGCSACTCYFLTQDRPGFYCLDEGAFVGLCQVDADCPVGTVCSAFEASETRFLCTHPCCAAT